MNERSVTFPSDGRKLAGVLRHPPPLAAKAPAVLLIHGTLEQDRDGNLLRHPDGRKVARKNLFLEIGRRLSRLGCAVFSWDKRGFGESEGPKGDLLSTVTDARAALDALLEQDDVVDPGRVVVLGQSAGVYTACLLAREDPRPTGYIFQGGLYRSYSELMSFNYGKMRDYARENSGNLAWVEKNNLRGLAMGLNLPELERAAREGREKFEMSYKRRTWKLRPETLCYQEGYAPAEIFSYVKAPVLILHGGCDLNVPVEDASLIREELARNGNEDVEMRIIPDADHSFQEVAGDEETRLREWMSMESFRHPFRQEYFDVLTEYLERRFMLD